MLDADRMYRPSNVPALGVFTSGLLGLLVLFGCSLPKTSTSAQGSRDFQVTGVVAAALARDVISITHEEIRDFMPAMTMPFTVRDVREAERLTPGDRVRFTLSIADDATHAHSFEVIGRDSAALDLARRSSSPSATRLRPGDMMPAFSLVDQDGVRISEALFEEQRTVLTFIFTRCPVPEFCPRITGYFRQLQRAIVQDESFADVRLMSVSLDPAFDTPAIMKAYGQAMGARFDRWRFATGTKEEVAILTRALAVRVEPSSAVLDHTLATAVVGPDGKLVEIWRGNAWTVSDVLTTLGRR